MERTLVQYERQWRGLSERFGNWHTICRRMDQWSKNSVLHRAPEPRQLAQRIRVWIEALSLNRIHLLFNSDGTSASVGSSHASSNWISSSLDSSSLR